MGEFSDTFDSRGNQLITSRPFDAISAGYGAYSLSQSTGTMAAALAAASQVWQFRWAPTSQNDIAVIERINISHVVLGTGFTAGTVLYSLFHSRSNTVAGVGGGTATITGNNAKRRTSMATTKLSEARISTTAALTAATETLDTQAFAQFATEVLTTADIVIAAPTNIYEATTARYPVVLAYQEAVVLKLTVPATGTHRLSITCDWFECHKGAF